MMLDHRDIVDSTYKHRALHHYAGIHHDAFTSTGIHSLGVGSPSSSNSLYISLVHEVQVFSQGLQ